MFFFSGLFDAAKALVSRNRADRGTLAVSMPRQPTGGWHGKPGSEDEERVGGAVSYLDTLDRLHRELVPEQYLEIGVRHGVSLALARGAAIGVDPSPEINCQLPTTTRVLTLTSDDFFAGTCDVAPDFCFIDGMHLAEFAFRDFINIEQRAASGAVVVFDDIFPNHPLQGQRERQTRVWTGDVWRLPEILRSHRPDLFILRLDVAPAGLLLVAGLDRAKRALHDDYAGVMRAALELPGPPQSVLERHGAVDPSGDYFGRVLESLRSARQAGFSPREITARLASIEK